MDLLRTGIGLTKTIKNVSRFREIINVLWRNGFDEFIIKFNLHSKVPGFVLPKKRIMDSIAQKDNTSFWQAVGYRLRKSFEELGPGFIKFGQLLATREDLLDPQLIKELKLLQNRVRPVEFDIVRKQIQKNLPAPIEEIFDYIEEKPIGVASIGSVHRARLKNGDEVVLKVKRPNIENTIKTDFEVIQFIVGQVERLSDDVKYLGVSRAIDDFFKSIELELNFLIEAQNCEKIRSNLKSLDTEEVFKVPKVYKEYSTSSMLVMEFLEGKPFNEIIHAKETKDLEKKLLKSVSMFTHTLLADGFFHADLHGGNFLWMPNGQIGLLDFGLMGTLSRKSRTNLVAILFALVTSNYENLVYEFLDVADYDVIPNYELLERDIKDALEPFLGLDVSDMDVTKLVNTIVTTLSKHQIYLPREWFIIFRALMTLDGVGKSLSIELNIFEVINDEIHDIMSDLVSTDKLIEDAAWIGRDAVNSLRIIPRHIKWALKEFAKKKYRFDVELSGFKTELNHLSRSILSVGLLLFSSALAFSGVYLIKDLSIEHLYDIPTICWILWSISTVFVFRAMSLVKL